MKSKEEIEQLAKQLCNIPIDLVIDEEEKYYKNFQKFDGVVLGYTQCQEDMADNFLSLIEEYREKELPDRNVPYHYEAEISSGLNFLIEFIKNKQD
jgi:hypothetical protein